MKLKKDHTREIKNLNTLVEQQKNQIKKKDDQIKDLKRRDAFHDGPNTPPSKDTITQQQRRKKRAKNR